MESQLKAVAQANKPAERLWVEDIGKMSQK